MGGMETDMKRFLMLAVSCVLLCAIAVIPAFAATSYEYANSSTPRVSGNLVAGMTLDYKTDVAMFVKDADKPYPVDGTVARLMTAYTAYRALRVDIPATLSLTDAAAEELILRLLYSTDNAGDAAQALAKGTYGSEAAFLDAMHRTAQVLGMSATNYINIDGTYAGAQVSTVQDQTKLLAAVYAVDMLKAPLSGTVCYNADKTLSFSRTAPLLTQGSAYYDNRACLYAGAGAREEGAFTLCAGINSSGRVVLSVFVEIGTDAASSYADATALFNDAYSAYSWCYTSRILKEAITAYTYTTDDGFTVTCAVETAPSYDGIDTYPYAYAVTLSESFDQCAIVLRSTPDQSNIAVGEILGRAALVYGNDTLAEFDLRVVKITTPDGQIYSKDYQYYNPDDYTDLVQGDYHTYYWVFYWGAIAVVALGLIIGASAVCKRMKI